MSPTARHVLFIADFGPGDNSAGALVLARHFHRLASEGWQITVSIPKHLSTRNDPAWRHAPLPERRWWWPPAPSGSPWLLKLRSRLWASPRHHHAARPDWVLTVLWGHAARTAAIVADKLGVPLGVIVHDLFRDHPLPAAARRAGDSLAREVLGRAGRVWCVSEEMKNTLQSLSRPDACRVLHPIPDGFALAPPRNWSAQPTVVHLGSLHDYQKPILEALARSLAGVGGRLLLVADPKDPVVRALKEADAPCALLPRFATPREALELVCREAHGFAVVCPPWRPKEGPHAGLPSRLLELWRTGVPALIFALPDHPAATWAAARKWPWVFPPETTSAEAAVNALGDRSAWPERLRHSARIAAESCDPAAIHRRWVAEFPVSTR